MRKFHQKIQNVDVLLMDDIQFIESKMQTMEDFFSTFEALYTNNKQIVIASDRQPCDIPKLDNRLRTRFEMGLVVEITPPDFQTRLKIVKEYAKQLGKQAPDEVFEYIAQNFKTNVRELKGAFNNVSAFCEFANSDITIENAQRALKLEIKKNELTAKVIAEKVAQYFDVTVKDLQSSARNQKVSKARQIAVYICREFLGMSYESIGEFFDKKHTTVMYSCNNIAEKISNDKEIKQTIENIKQTLKD
jgi:chromosomal replication initiator protein